MERERIVAIGLLAEAHLEMLRDCLPKVFAIADDRSFDDILRALDAAEDAGRAMNGASPELH